MPERDLDVPLERLRRRTGVKWRRHGGDVLAAWVADMDFPVADPIRRALRALVEEDDLGYPDLSVADRLGTVVADRLRDRFGLEVDPDMVVPLTDVVQGIHLAIDRFSEPGEGVVVQTPVYPPFLAAVAEHRRRLVDHRLVATPGGYVLDREGLADLAGDDTRVVLLCNPHNPTGRVLDRAELEAVAEVALERDLLVVADEIHADLVYPGRTHISFPTLGPDVAERTVLLVSPSKAFNIAGLRTAFAVCFSARVHDRLRSVPSHLLGRVGAPGIAATAAAWREAQPWLDAVLARLAEHRDLVAGTLASRVPSVVHHPPEATYLAWLDCRALALDTEPARHLLDHARVAVSDGPAFGPNGVGHVRLNFATSRPVLEEILERVVTALRPADTAI